MSVPSLLASEEWSLVQQIAPLWAHEIGMSAVDLEERLVRDALRGEIEHQLPGGDLTEFRNWARAAQAVGAPLPPAFEAIARRLLLHRDAVLRYARSQGWPPPSWLVGVKPPRRQTTVLAKSRGRPPKETDRVIREMRQFLADGGDLHGMTEEAMVATFGARSRDTCRRARNSILRDDEIRPT